MLFTDGSVMESCRNGGAGVVVTKGSSLVEEVRMPAERVCSSFHAELVPICASLNWLIENVEDWTKLAW